MTVLHTMITTILGVGLLASACSGRSDEGGTRPVRQVAEELIRTEVADEAGLGELAPVCPEVEVVAVGTAFQCTATTSDGRRITVDGVINFDGRIELATTNLIVGSALPSFERAAVEALNNSVGTALEPETVDCGQSSVVLVEPDPIMVCALFDPGSQQTYDVSLTITDIEGRQFMLVVADQPRP